MDEQAIRNYDFTGEGEILLIDKPIDWTSFDVVKKVRMLFHVRKVGHAGTLDPKATGLLIVCTGRKTKWIERFVGLEKEYCGAFELGIRTPSFDTETEVLERKDCSSIHEQHVRMTAEQFCGKQLQAPPMYSAVKYGGKPLYQYARAGRVLNRAEREIDVRKFEITRFSHPYAEFCLVCSKGTYVRSLVDEVGLKLGCGATLKTLRRQRIGEHTVSQALTIEQLTALRSKIELMTTGDHGSDPNHP